MEEYFESINEEISSQFARLQKLIGVSPAENLEVGLYHEHILAEAISHLLPQRFSIRSGFIIGHQKSGQQDIMVIDENEPTTYLMKYGNFAVVRPDSVKTAIQVKTRLESKEQFSNAFKNISSAKATLTTPMYTNMITGIFAYKTVEGISDEKLADMFSAVCDVQVAHYPDFIFFRSEGLLLLKFQEGDQFIYRRVFRGGEGNDASWQLSVIVYLILSACGGMNSGSGFWQGFINQSGAQKGIAVYLPAMRESR